MDASDTACSLVRALRTTVLAQQTEIGELRAIDRRRQIQLIEALTLLRMLQTQMAALQSQQTPARDLAHPDVPEEVGKNGTKKNHQVNTSHNNYPTTSMTNEQLKRLIDQGVADTLAARDANRSRNGEDSYDSHTGVRRQAPPARECTYPDFMKYKPLYFKGTEGVVELIQWFKRMETMFRISNYCMENQIKFSICTLLGSALTWWNSHVKTVGHDVAYPLTWTYLKKKMTEKYCPKGEELALMCARMFPEESDKIEKYVGGLPDMIHGSGENNRKQDDNQQQQQNKRQNTGRAYFAGSGEKKPYGGSKPLCSKCNYYHDGQKPTCLECGAQGHFKRGCPKLKNKNHGNQAEMAMLQQKCMRSFMSTAFSSQIDITPTTLDHYYDVELAAGE
ncbi:putative reverse transcriptase domain-containing protein [Tanacetum coccineum]